VPVKQSPTTLTLQSGVNPKREPFVQLVANGEIVCQMRPAEARAFARTLLEAAEATEQDAFIYDWVINHVAAGEAQAIGLIVDFRRYRAERFGKSQGPTRPEDWVMPNREAGEPA